MHERSPYALKRPDFAALAQAYPPLRPFVSKTRNGAVLNFKNPRAVRELTYAMLSCDFGIRLEIPLSSLCPTVPGRLDYVLHIEDLVGSDDSRDVRGIDIGTGSSCIYPLLACERNPRWHFIALETDKRSIAFAQSNVERNNMQDRIRVVRSTETAPLLAVVEDGPGQAGADGSFDFCMCNPPFYKDPEQIEQSRKAKSTAPAAVCMGTSGEMITDGGEVAFVSRMVHESLVLRGRVRWYSSLLGFRSSARAIETLLRIEGVPVVRCDAFRQGPTTRWVVAWSFGTPESAEPAGSPSDSAELPSHLAGSKRKAPPDEPESEARRARRV